ncbi:hypothetical protein [Nocardia australiensis]|uniref:hypothetical protein n=1 Tax=Nocardia australiensis TaxID=2887191 RepID=UPI001D137461|nr:hypothetical protein [Nocardia australiensis]
MWAWGRTVAERAAAAAWTSWQSVPTRPTVLDAEVRAEADEDDPDREDNRGVAPARHRDFELAR